MNKFFKIINYIILALISLNLGFASIEEYEFKIEFDHDFDDSNKIITCEIKYDNKEKDFEFDKDSKDDDLEYIKNFKYDLEVDCNEDIDKITLFIYDEDEDRIDKIKYEDDDKFDYILDLVQKDQTWFEIELIDRFKEDTDCSLKVDSDIYDYSFNEDTDDKRLTIQKNYKTDFRLLCDEQIGEIKLKVYDKSKNEVFKEKYNNLKVISFDNNFLLEKNLLNLEINYDFSSKNSKSKLTCDFEKNGKETTHTFKSSDKLEIKETISNKFKISCDDTLKELKINIFDENNKKLISKTFENKRVINYEMFLQDYLFEIKIESKFTQTTYCNQILDDNSKLEKEFRFDTDLTSYTIKGSFDKLIDLKCSKPLDKVTMYIYPNDKTKSFSENTKNKIYTKTFGKDSTIDYKLDKSKLKKIIEPQVTIQDKKSKENDIIKQELSKDINNEIQNNLNQTTNKTKIITQKTSNLNSQIKPEILIIYTCIGLFFLLLIILIIKKLLK